MAFLATWTTSQRLEIMDVESRGVIESSRLLPWLSVITASDLVLVITGSPHRCAFQPETGNVWVKPSSACRWSDHFFSWNLNRRKTRIDKYLKNNNTPSVGFSSWHIKKAVSFDYVTSGNFHLTNPPPHSQKTKNNNIQKYTHTGKNRQNRATNKINK